MEDTFIASGVFSHDASSTHSCYAVLGDVGVSILSLDQGRAVTPALSSRQNMQVLSPKYLSPTTQASSEHEHSPREGPDLRVCWDVFILQNLLKSNFFFIYSGTKIVLLTLFYLSYRYSSKCYHNNHLGSP